MNYVIVTYTHVTKIKDLLTYLLICLREMSLIGSTSFGFAQNATKTSVVYKEQQIFMLSAYLMQQIYCMGPFTKLRRHELCVSNLVKQSSVFSSGLTKLH